MEEHILIRKSTIFSFSRLFVFFRTFSYVFLLLSYCFLLVSYFFLTLFLLFLLLLTVFLLLRERQNEKIVVLFPKYLLFKNCCLFLTFCRIWTFSVRMCALFTIIWALFWRFWQNLKTITVYTNSKIMSPILNSTMKTHMIFNMNIIFPMSSYAF